MAELRTPQGHTLLLPEGSVSIGADPANEVPVAAHLGLAPVHFRLQPWEGGHFLEDAGSGLGTLVNGYPVNWKPLTHGDIITAGELEVVYGQQAEAASRPVPVIVAPSAQPPVTSPVAPSPVFPAVPPAPPIPLFGGLPPVATPAFNLSSLAVTSHAPVPHPPAPAAVPPAWLPVDLLPEAYQLPPAKPEQVPAKDSVESATSASSAPLPKSPIRHRAGRRLVPLAAAALFAILAWAGHTAWQRGHLAPLFHSLGADQGQATPSQDSPASGAKTPATESAQPHATRRSTSLPSSVFPASSSGPAPSPAPPAPAAEIATQIGR